MVQCGLNQDVSLCEFENFTHEHEVVDTVTSILCGGSD